MSTDLGYRDFIADLLSDLGGVSLRPMMGEYVVYLYGKVVGGIYDCRFLVKPTEGALSLLKEEEKEPHFEIPYEGAKQMLAVDVDDRSLACRLVQVVANDLPEPKPKKRG